MSTTVTAALQTFGGIATRAEILAQGCEPEQVRRAWRSGAIERVRHGVYAIPGMPDDVIRAARVGGVLAAESAAAHHGLWVPPGEVLAVSVAPTASGLRDPDQPGRPLDRRTPRVRLIHDRHRLEPDRDRPVVGSRACVLQIVRDAPPPTGLAVLDSAIRTFSLSTGALAGLAAELPRRCRPVVEAADGKAESGTESAMAWGLRRLGLPFEAQKWVTDRIRVDFVVAGFVVVECVSFEHHGRPRDYEVDRERIAAVVREGYVALECTYHQVWGAWETVADTIVRAVTRG